MLQPEKSDEVDLSSLSKSAYSNYLLALVGGIIEAQKVEPQPEPVATSASVDPVQSESVKSDPVPSNDDAQAAQPSSSETPAALSSSSEAPAAQPSSPAESTPPATTATETSTAEDDIVVPQFLE